MPINNFSSYIKTCLEEKDYDLYERIAKDESANAFFEQLEEVYFEETLKYREGFISKAVETKTKLDNITKEKEVIIEKLKAQNILIDEPDFEDFDFSQYDLMSIEAIAFSFNDLYQIKFTKEEIEYIQNYVEKNKNSNIPVILKSPAEVKYEELLLIKEIYILFRKINKLLIEITSIEIGKEVTEYDYFKRTGEEAIEKMLSSDSKWLDEIEYVKSQLLKIHLKKCLKEEDKTAVKYEENLGFNMLAVEAFITLKKEEIDSLGYILLDKIDEGILLENKGEFKTLKKK